MRTTREFVKGNEALALGALKAGMNAYFAYPITPSSEVPETLAREFGSAAYPEFKVFLQAASELEAINMVIGAASTGAKVMTATSGPGFSLKQEGMSYAAGMELPFLIADVNRAGPGLGNLGPEQSDYFQATRGGGHGGYRTPVLAPGSVQEMATFPALAFSLGFRYRTPVVILADAFLGQLKEDIEFPRIEPEAFAAPWAVTGAKGAQRHVIASLHLDFADQSLHSEHLAAKYERIEAAEQRSDAYMVEDADVLLVAYGISARLCRQAVNSLRGRNLRAGLFRPLTLWPFPAAALRKLVDGGIKRIVVVELNNGQMVQDVRLAVEGKASVDSVRKVGGLLPATADVVAKVEMVSR